MPLPRVKDGVLLLQLELPFVYPRELFLQREKRLMAIPSPLKRFDCSSVLGATCGLLELKVDSSIIIPEESIGMICPRYKLILNRTMFG